MPRKSDEWVRHRSAADALLRIVLITVREQTRAASAAGQAPDFAALVSDPVNAPCLADLLRIGLDLAATPAGGDMAAIAVEIADVDPAFAGWRAVILEAAWVGIEGSAS